MPELLQLTVTTECETGLVRLRLYESIVRFARRTLSVADLIRTKLQQEIHAFNERQATCYGGEYLVDREWRMRCREGRRLLGAALKKGKVSPNAEAKLAIGAFVDRKFQVLLDGQDLMMDPTRMVSLTETSKLAFVRLNPVPPVAEAELQVEPLKFPIRKRRSPRR